MGKPKKAKSETKKLKAPKSKFDNPFPTHITMNRAEITRLYHLMQATGDDHKIFEIEAWETGIGQTLNVSCPTFYSANPKTPAFGNFNFTDYNNW